MKNYSYTPPTPHIFSVVYNGKDVLSHCVENIAQQHIVHGQKHKIIDICLEKIIATIQYFVRNDMIPDGKFVKSLIGNIFEFRIQLPKSNFLVRIVAACKKDEIILLTGFVLKPSVYADKKSIEAIDKTYEKIISHAIQIWSDYTDKKTYPYISLDVLLPR